MLMFVNARNFLAGRERLVAGGKAGGGWSILQLFLGRGMKIEEDHQR
jgi:hypothetical protein